MSSKYVDIPASTSYRSDTHGLESPSSYASTHRPQKGAPLSGQREILPAHLKNNVKLNDDDDPSRYHGSTFKLVADTQVSDRQNGESSSSQRTRKATVNMYDLMDAPSRAAMNLPNGLTATQQAKAVRRGDAPVTPQYELSGNQVELTSGDRSHAPSRLSHSLLLEEYGGSTTVTGPSSPRAPSIHLESPGNSTTPLYSTSEVDTLFASKKDREANGDYFQTNGSTAESLTTSRSPSPAPGSSPLLRRVLIDRPSSPSRRPTFPPPSLSTYAPRPPRPLTFYDRCNVLALQTASFLVSTTFLIGVVAWAVSTDIIHQVPRLLKGKSRKRTFPWDDDKYWQKNEKVTKDPRDYALAIGMDIDAQTVETADGYYLRMHRVLDPDARPKSDGRGGFPVLILHGLFQSSGSFITSEDRSLAFWLAKQGGYQVYLGNTRGVYGMGHRNYSKSDPRFWDWTIRELAMFDLPALVDHVCSETGYDKIAFIGHSQGNGLAFISLSMGMCPELGSKLTLFSALAPAVYAGPLTSGFPFTQLSQIEWPMWKRLFGVLDFIPLMRWAYDYCPPKIFATMGYVMFAFLFSWTDTNWLHRRKTKMFRFTPTPVSSASIFWWCGKGGFATRKCTLDDSIDQWFDHRFPPLSLYYGGRDFLVLAEPLLERIEKREKHVKLIRAQKLDLSEHCDFYWAAEAVEWVYYALQEDIERTRPRYPGEE